MNNELGIQNSRIRSFKDLDAWKESHKLVLMTYEVTKQFPKEEMFGLVSQLRRAIISVTSNIAEGFSRQSYKDKVYFYSMALGSLTEVQSQLQASFDLKYINKEKFEEIDSQTIIANKIINGLIKHSKSIIHNS